jgi:hypothetical protein
VPRRIRRGRLCVCLTPPLTCGHGEAYALCVEGACQYNPHIAQTVPHRSSQNACTGRTLAQTSHALCDIRVIHVGIVRKSWSQGPTADRVVEEPHDNR